MARLGARVQMAGRIGSDTFGPRLLHELETAGVDASLVEVDPDEASGVALILLSPRGKCDSCSFWSEYAFGTG